MKNALEIISEQRQPGTVGSLRQCASRGVILRNALTFPSRVGHGHRVGRVGRSGYELQVRARVRSLDRGHDNIVDIDILKTITKANTRAMVSECHRLLSLTLVQLGRRKD